jgi:hypothetical protein
MTYDRPWAAVDVLAGMVQSDQDVDRDLIERVLVAAAQSEQVDAAVHAAWEVGQLLDALEAAALPTERLAGLEFTFFALVDDVRPPRALPAALASDPELFVLLARHVYARTDGAEEDDVRPELASHAWRVLHELRRVPGQRADGSVDAAQLREWVEEVRRRLSEADRSDAADDVLGQLLSSAPLGSDGIWPAEPVRDIVERLRSPHFDSGLEIGRLNARGITMRDSYDGGAQERALADGLRADARRLQARWSRTARILRSMADSYEDEARQHDREAERLADEG